VPDGGGVTLGVFGAAGDFGTADVLVTSVLGKTAGGTGFTCCVAANKMVSVCGSGVSGSFCETASPDKVRTSMSVKTILKSMVFLL
jgi:hypothetical protein